MDHRRALALVALAAFAGCSAASSISPPLQGSRETVAAMRPAGGNYLLNVTDYFTGKPLPIATVVVDGKIVKGSKGRFTFSLGNGLHEVTAAAKGYATYETGVQAGGGSTARAVALFPLAPSTLAWIAQIGKDRKANGAGPVTVDDMLVVAAYDHAADMLSRGYFAHFDPHGFSPTTRSLLLGSMLPGWENIAAGYNDWQAAEAAFMAEKANLPNKSPNDCAKYWNDAGHYCNIVDKTHDRVGVSIVAASGTKFGTYYDEEFGDLYGWYDPTVAGPEPALGTSAVLDFAAGSGASGAGGYMQFMASPVAIAIATLNADPTCSSQCPSADQWWPGGGGQVSNPIPLTFGTNQVFWPELVATIGGSLTYAAFAAKWAGGNALPTTYHRKGIVVWVRAAVSGVRPALVPNPEAMRVTRTANPDRP